jgi:phosphatidate cytidylyltransferase
MKTRIISGIIMALLVAGILTLGFMLESLVITVTVAILALIAVYELLHNAAGIKDVQSLICACLFTFIIAALNGITKDYRQSLVIVFFLAVVYTICAAIMVLRNHGRFGLGRIISLFTLPIIYGVAFFCLDGIINNKNGIYYLLLLLNFSSVCDMGAYFVGVTLGKHKLCPNISPKKTVEGAIGGILSSVVVTLILCLCFDKTIWLMLLITIPLCILGMIGDLFASSIKRAVGIKDYGNLIPGHGGVMDRLDSIIMIAPLMYVFTLLSVI